MTKQTNKKKRNKLIVALIAPLIVIGLIVGWSLLWKRKSGEPKMKRSQKPTNKTTAEQDESNLIVIPPKDE
jgi:flagellar basal body-associated protein FliL